jgi:hypothetical protein
MEQVMNCIKAFISCSHRDKRWFDRLVTHLKVLENLEYGGFHVWADTQLKDGEDWEERINQAMGESRVAILITANFLASKFIQEKELPRLLERHEEDGMLIFPLIVRPCAWKLVDVLSSRLARPRTAGRCRWEKTTESMPILQI